MTILYRHQKGAPLTAEEVDGNFYELVSRLEALEQKATQNESIVKIEQKGDQLEFMSSFGNILGQFKLPTLQYTLRGKWTTGTSYASQDVVTRDAQTWVCTTAHTSTTEFDANFWKILLDASENLKSPSLPSQMPIFLNDTLPNPVLGHVGILVSPDKISFVYSDGNVWYSLQNSEKLNIGEPKNV